MVPPGIATVPDVCDLRYIATMNVTIYRGRASRYIAISRLKTLPPLRGYSGAGMPSHWNQPRWSTSQAMSP